MALTTVDRNLLQRCFAHNTGAWNDFVDRFLGLTYHVIHYTSHLRSIPLLPEEVEDIAQEIMLQFVADDYALLRQFQGKSSLATYLTVVGRRICVQELAKRAPVRKALPPEMRKQTNHSSHNGNGDSREEPALRTGESKRSESLDEVEKLLRRLPSQDREVVRLFYLEGRTYEEISIALNITVKSIGPVLANAKKRLKHSEEQAEPKKTKVPKTPKPPHRSAE